MTDEGVPELEDDDVEVPGLDDHTAYLGPDPGLLHAYSVASYSPLFLALSGEEQQAVWDRVVAVRSLPDLAEADRELLEAGVAQVEVGANPHLAMDPSRDWQAVDEEADEDDEPAEDGPAGVPAADDDGWVGV